MTQISNMKVISLMVDSIEFIKVWHLSIGVWQKVALHNRTQYLAKCPSFNDFVNVRKGHFVEKT